MTSTPAAPLTAQQVADLAQARDTIHALRDWPDVRKRWLAAIRARERVVTMSPERAYERLQARDRLYARARETVAELSGPWTARSKR